MKNPISLKCSRIERYLHVAKESARLQRSIKFSLGLATAAPPGYDSSKQSVELLSDELSALIDEHSDCVNHLMALFGASYPSASDEEITAKVTASLALIDAQAERPLRTLFSQWLKPIEALAPGVGIIQLGGLLDALSLRKWCDIGDRCACVGTGIVFGQTMDAAKVAFGTAWLTANQELAIHLSAFKAQASEREELKLFHTKRHLGIGLSSTQALAAQWLLRSVTARDQQADSEWFLRLFDLDATHSRCH